jgi:hypothetical protein
LEKKMPGATKTISLYRLENALEAEDLVQKGVEVSVSHAAPWPSKR